MSYRTRQRRKPIAEINVVPYIDVMLVLLIIFMITAPMLTQGVKVDLPKAQASRVKPIKNQEPLIVSVDAQGNFYASIGDNQDKPLTAEQLMVKAAAVLRRSPTTQVLVRGDSSVSYGHIITAMALLQKAGAPSVGLLTHGQNQKSSENN